jgi:hypothetical protein
MAMTTSVKKEKKEEEEELISYYTFFQDTGTLILNTASSVEVAAD